MNFVSWLIYIAEVLPNVSDMLFGLFLTALIISGIVAFTCIVVYQDIKSREDRDYYSDRQKLTLKEGAKNTLKLLKKVINFAVLSFIVVLVSLLIPSSTTIYMIAASEMGEEVIKTPEVSETFSKLNEILQFKIHEAHKELTSE